MHAWKNVQHHGKNTSRPHSAVTPPFLINSFTTISYRIVYLVLYLKWFLLTLRLYNFISGNNSNSKELLLIESVYHGLGHHLLKIPSPLILLSALGVGTTLITTAQGPKDILTVTVVQLDEGDLL